jgi:hypothetical protein
MYCREEKFRKTTQKKKLTVLCKDCMVLIVDEWDTSVDHWWNNDDREKLSTQRKLIPVPRGIKSGSLQ